MDDIQITEISFRKVKTNGTLGRNRIRPSIPDTSWLVEGSLDNPDMRWQYQQDVWSYPLRFLRWVIRG